MTDSIAIQALEDAVGRVNSMILLYDNLYNSDNSTDVPLNDYLPNLVDQIIVNFPNRSRVNTRLDIGAITLDSRKMHPVGLIVNELLTNIMKYAFKGREKGSIVIHAAMSGDRVRITVQDDGNGIPEGVDFGNSPGFGLMLVSSLTDQLKGSIRIERGNGTKIILDFEI
jgi:two-component sensor histidine kinase